MYKEIKGEPNLMDIQQTAEYLGLSVGTIYQWRSQHKVPYIKVGRRVKFKKEQLDQWLTERTVQVGIEPGSGK
jgi:excisionase family DNA binding protein